MVIRSRLSTPGLLVAGLLLIVGPSTVRGASDDPDGRVRSALAEGAFPWYDKENDRVRAIKLPEPPTPPKDRTASTAAPGWLWGDYLVFGVFVAALAVLIGLVLYFWKRFEPDANSTPDGDRSAPSIRSGEVLPAGLGRNDSTEDPWAEANRRRLSGDLSGAILCLFAHQLLTLSRLGLVRLAPGRTGRQLHRAVADAEFRALMAPTLRQFEKVYYGHQAPTPGDFAVVWTSAEALERRLVAEVPR